MYRAKNTYRLESYFGNFVKAVLQGRSVEDLAGSLQNRVRQRSTFFIPFVYPPLPRGCQRRCRAERSATHRDSCPSWKIWRVCWEARTRFDVQRSLSVCVCAAELQGKNWIGKSDSGGGGAIWQVTQQRRIHTWDLSHVVIPAAYWTIHVYAFQVNLKFCILIQNISIFFLKKSMVYVYHLLQEFRDNLMNFLVILW